MPRPHKYIKREGAPGSYRYFYYDPSAPGHLREGNPEEQEAGKNEHARRLIAAAAAGHHSMSTSEMAAHTGLEARRIREHISNMRQKGRRVNPSAAKPEAHGHDFAEHHLKEAHHADPVVASAHHGKAFREANANEPTPSVGHPASPRSARSGAVPEPSGPGFSGVPSDPANYQGRTDLRRRATTGRAAGDIPETDEAPHRRLREEMTSRARAAAGAASAPENTGAPRSPSETRAGETRAGTADAEREAAQKKHLETLARHGVHFDQSPAQRAQAARATVTERNRAASPTAPAARELAEVDPGFAASEGPIREMVAAQARGENPYLNRAKEIYERIQGDLKPERREVVKNIFAAMHDLESHHEAVNEGSLLSRYKELSGSSRVRTLPKDEFEKGTFITLDEIMGNKPVDVEVERMKRGYGAKQFARMKPFLKSSFTDRNPSAPPPFPTFGDVKSWSEHGGPKPSWAGTTRLAMPKEVFDATVKGADGKPQYPPAWMPIHLMPVWNYIAKKSQSGEGFNAYQTSTPHFQGDRAALGNQASFQEGVAIASLRKYVQMRGGPEQLVDIPSSKLHEIGTSHAEIFKSEDLSDEKLKKLITRKIIDPVAFLPVLKKEMEKSGKKTQKSFALVIDSDTAPVSFQKSFVVAQTLSKSEMIDRIRALKTRRG